MKKIPADRFKILGSYVYLTNLGWTLLTEFKNVHLAEPILLSHFNRYRAEHIRDNEYWFWDFNDVIEMADLDRFRLKVRVPPGTYLA